MSQKFAKIILLLLVLAGGFFIFLISAYWYLDYRTAEIAPQAQLERKIPVPKGKSNNNQSIELEKPPFLK